MASDSVIALVQSIHIDVLRLQKSTAERVVASRETARHGDQSFYRADFLKWRETLERVGHVHDWTDY